MLKLTTKVEVNFLVILTALWYVLVVVFLVFLLKYRYFLNKFYLYLIQLEEVNNIEEGVFTWFLLFFLTSSTVTLIFFYNINNVVDNLYYPFFLIKLTLIFIPISYLYYIGFNFINFIRGCSVTTFFIYEYILDVSNVLSVFLRILLQSIRILIIFITLTTFILLWNEISSVLDYFFISFNMYNELMFTSYIILIIHYLFEIFHFFIVFIMQISAFSVMTIWLFQFLYTSLVSPLLEK